MALERNLALGNERPSNVTALCTHQVALNILIGLGEAQPECDEQNGRAGTKPVQWAPAVRCGVDETARERGSQEVAKGIALLQHTRDDATGLLGAVLERGGCGVAVQTAHGNAEEGAAGQELPVGLAESRAELEHDEQEVVDDEGPAAAIAICCDTEED